jgi:hypothetical protein
VQAHGGDLGATTPADLAVIAGGVVIMVIGITILLLARNSSEKKRYSKLGAPLVAAGLFVALLGPGLIPSSPSVCSRPTTAAKVEILSPDEGELLESPEVAVQVSLRGAKLSDVSSSTNTEGSGHLHLTLDNKVISMTSEMSQTIIAEPGEHLLEAEFLANDHGPFCKRVRDAVSFSVGAQPS